MPRIHQKRCRTIWSQYLIVNQLRESQFKFIGTNQLHHLDVRHQNSPDRIQKSIWHLPTYFYRPQIWGKVIFLHLSVILFTGGRGGTPRQVHPLGRYPPGQVHTPWAGTPPRQVHPRAGTPQAGTPPWVGTPPWAVHAGRYGQQAGGTHPTGMHFCWFIGTFFRGFWQRKEYKKYL